MGIEVGLEVGTDVGLDVGIDVGMSNNTRAPIPHSRGEGRRRVERRDTTDGEGRRRVEGTSLATPLLRQPRCVSRSKDRKIKNH